MRQPPYFFLGAESPLAAKVRTNVTTAWISPSVMFPLNPGMLPLPSVTAWASSASDLLWTAADRRSATCRLFPTGVLPLPSCPWQVAHFVLYTSAPAVLSWPAAGLATIVMAMTSMATGTHAPTSGGFLLGSFIVPQRICDRRSDLRAPGRVKSRHFSGSRQPNQRRGDCPCSSSFPLSGLGVVWDTCTLAGRRLEFLFLR